MPIPIRFTVNASDIEVAPAARARREVAARERAGVGSPRALTSRTGIISHWWDRVSGLEARISRLGHWQNRSNRPGFFSRTSNLERRGPARLGALYSPFGRFAMTGT